MPAIGHIFVRILALQIRQVSNYDRHMMRERVQEDGEAPEQERGALIREAVDRLEEEVRHSLPASQYSKLVSNLDRISSSIRKYGNERDSPIISILGHVGNYWRSGILSLLLPMPQRPSAMIRQFAALAPEHPISHRILTLNLRALERDGLIRRYAVGDSRAHVEYELTEMGRQVCQFMWSVIDWGEENYDKIVRSREKFDEAD